MSLDIAYLVHDLGDAAVARRVAQLRSGKARVALAGFHRRAAPAEVSGAPALALGRSRDGRLVQRALLVAFVLLRPARIARLVRGADLVIARNLEMLVIAALLVRPGQRLVYECLDIHRVMLGRGLAGRVMRRIERWALARTRRVLVSSPAFEHEYFRKRQRWAGPVELVENKVAAMPDASAGDMAGPPWVIGWFGMLRCRRSFALLADLAARSDGAVEVLVAGIPSPAVFDDLPGEIARRNGMRFAGRYSPGDLPRLYGAVHFAWCIDYFEEGLNSDWLLPNRLYEGLAHGAVPMALAGMETGRWLAREGVGMCLPRGEDAAEALAAMTPDHYRQLRGEVAALAPGRIAFRPADNRRLVQRLAGEAAA